MTLGTLYLTAAGTVLTIVLVLWAISVRIRDASIIDIFWGPLFVAITWVLLAGAESGLTTRLYWLTLAVTLWGTRLGLHLATRNLGQGEDRRYQLWREHGGPNWPLKSLYRVYLLQGAICLAVATPIIAAFYRPDGFSVLNGIGVAVWISGFLYESLADIQLTRFKADPANRGKLITTGLWSRSRHPNYFGDALQWFGLALIALTAATWWALVGPVLMTAVFLGISNSVLERGMRKRHAGYENYIANTPEFFPRISRWNSDTQ